MIDEGAKVVRPPRCEEVVALRAQEGGDVYLSEWVLVDQARIDGFANATGDFQWIHVDPVRAGRESPFGSTIAHGFLTLSLLGKFYEDFLPELLPLCDIGVNYGLNKVRFTQPVRVDSRVRGRFRLVQVQEVSAGVQMVFAATIEIEHEAKPACVSESVVRRYFRAGLPPQ